jgi:hypothetical protein
VDATNTIPLLLYNDFPEVLNDAGSANPPLLSLYGVIDMNDWGFFRNAVG